MNRFDPNTSNWDFVTEVKGGAGTVFPNLTQGKYRVLAMLPYYNENTCKTDAQGNIIRTRVQILSTLGQFLGYLGTHDNSPFGGNCFCYSNEALAGATTPSDISYTFVDIPETSSEAAYDNGESARMNTAASRNYNLWWLAIFENGPTYQRYRSNNWTNGTVPNNLFDLSLFWGQGGSGWQFETFHTYDVQFVIENAQCRNGVEQNPPATWNVLTRTFFICPAGTGCRIGEEAQKIVLSPNPASSFIRLLHFEMDAGREYRLTIADLAGRTVRSTTLTSMKWTYRGLGTGCTPSPLSGTGSGFSQINWSSINNLQTTNRSRPCLSVRERCFFIMKTWLIIPIFLFQNILTGQNLVPNPGFDKLNGCPTAFSQIYLASPWLSASNGTPDVLNKCSPSQSNFLKIPNAGRWIDSYQLPKSGDGFAAIEVYTNVGSSNGNSEYLEAPLIAPLEKSKAYYLEFYVSPDVTPMFYSGFTDAIGLALSDTFYYKNLGPTEALPLKPVIENRYAVISDTVGWKRISGCYTARGGERYAIIGNFRSTQETLVQFVNPTYPFNSYFYIEDVLIQVFDPLPETLLLCDGDSKVLNAAFLDATYRWNTGSNDSVVTVQSPGLYTVEATMEKCVLRDTVRIMGIEGISDFPSDTAICQGEPLWLTAPVIGNYQWSDGSTSKEIEITISGNYALTVTNECGQFKYAADVNIKDCGCNIYIPNVFSPNGDGWNDELEVFTGCDYPLRMLCFSVYDRWGNNIYTAKEGKSVRWDGSCKGQIMPTGVYVWLMEYEVVRNGVTGHLTQSGDISIVR